MTAYIPLYYFQVMKRASLYRAGLHRHDRYPDVSIQCKLAEIHKRIREMTAGIFTHPVMGQKRRALPCSNTAVHLAALSVNIMVQLVRQITDPPGFFQYLIEKQKVFTITLIRETQTC